LHFWRRKIAKCGWVSQSLSAIFLGRLSRVLEQAAALLLNAAWPREISKGISQSLHQCDQLYLIKQKMQYSLVSSIKYWQKNKGEK